MVEGIQEGEGGRMNIDNIPQELKDLKQWVNWAKKGTSPGDRGYKVPYHPVSGNTAKAGIPDTWGSFGAAYANVQAGAFQGIGFEFADSGGFVGIDLDHVLENGELVGWAQDVVDIFDSYTEVSPSGTGLHILVKGSVPKSGKKKKIEGDQALELYQSRRYFTVTGNVYGETKPIEPRQQELDELWKELFPTPTQQAPAPLPADDFLQIGLEKDEKLRAYWGGYRPTGDESGNDQAFMNKLAYWCNKDIDQMIAAFLASPYAQQKDDTHQKKAQREDYLRRTAETAIRDTTSTATEDRQQFQRGRAKEVFAPKGEADLSDTRLSMDTVKTALKSLRITVRYDTLLKETEITGLPECYSKENVLNTLPVVLMDYLKSCKVKGVTRQAIDDYLGCISDENRFNRLEEYLNSGLWDGVDRLGDVYSILGVTKGKYQTYIKKWAIQCVALGLNDEAHPVRAEGVLVLQGEQGLAKTSFFRILTPFPLWFVEGAVVDLKDKDSLINVLSGWIAELGELDSTLKREQSSLKAFITSPQDRIRRPYGRNHIITPRRTSFCGTVNPKEYLRDETGSRRFWTVPVEQIDKAALFSLSPNWVHQFWLQVYELYKKNPNGFRLTDQEMKTLQMDNHQFDMPLPYETEIRELLDYSLPVDQWEWWKAGQLASQLGHKDAARPIGKALNRVVVDLKDRWDKGVSGGSSNPRITHGYSEYLIPLKHFRVEVPY